MKVECHEVESFLGLYVEKDVSEAQSAMVRAHLNTCEACALLALEMEFTISLCKEFPELEPPLRLIERVLQQTTGRQQSLSWTEYLRELFRPLYASPRFATGACLAAISFSIVMNALGVNLGEVRWSELTPRRVVDSLNRTANVAYDNGMRRLNDLKILYQIQSKIEELQAEDSEEERAPKPEPKAKERLQQNSATEHLMAFRAVVSSGRTSDGRTHGARGIGFYELHETS
ncbi:MAG: zf-HC2 domain-containing protein [Acidobacteria bacterium]|nr:zf-HC2 domain-containing protein [Acidobacteriota bacterium]MCI0620780.1 zf-HC2 domain-containing protein [Acidobacteriota bacterium]MCI0720180.1 zf-HC2 domain-containing protein [Acidobacteriota bacterium]